MKVRARLTEKDVNTRKPAYTVLALKAAVLGALMSENHVENGWLDAVTIFRDSTTVDKHLARAVRFKERQGVSALELVDKFFSARLAWLADRCSCERLRIDHLMGEVDHAFDEFHAGLERFMRDGKPSAVQAPEWVLHG